jgi:hypothetical protein
MSASLNRLSHGYRYQHSCKNNAKMTGGGI